MNQPFSFTEIEQATKDFKEVTPNYFIATDSTNLAYYRFALQSSKAIILFYHGGGAWSKSMYQLMAQQTAYNYNMGGYLFDIRGHGHSEGTRGDATSSKRVLDDITDTINFIVAKYPKIPLLLAGHSSGAGLILNYLAQTKECRANGCIFLAPFLGVDAKKDIEYHEQKKQFVNKVHVWALVMHSLSGGRLFKHIPAVYFNYGELNKKDPLLLHYYTCAMATAVFPRNVKATLAKCQQPCAFFIGEEDELFEPDKIIAYREYCANRHLVARIIPDANHLSIVIKAPELFAEAFAKFLL